MIHIIYGEDVLARDEQFSTIRPDAEDSMTDMNTLYLNGSSVSMEELVQACNTVPFLADTRTIVVRGLLSRFDSRNTRGQGKSSGKSRKGKDEWSQFADRLSEMPPTTTLIILDENVNGNNRILRALRPLATVNHCRLPTARDMQTWVRQRANRLGTPIEPRAIVELVNSIGNNTLLMSNELEKLSIYRLDEQIRVEDVQALVASVRESNIFQAVDAVLEGKTGIALSLIHGLIDEGNHPMLILTMIARQTRFLLLAKDLKKSNTPKNEIGKRLGVSGYPLDKTLQQEPKFTEAQLREIHNNLLIADLSIKTGAADEIAAIDMLVLQLSV